ncbi:hypothetical protein ABW20_dc0101833 [Dactylellina cionopaga]|nr:hypothetical protein ABW20_dc0101833 [Dactylellina cionopaga]
MAHFGHTSMPLWQFVGLIVMFSILLGSPIFVCFVYHRRKERDRLRVEVRRALTYRSPYQIPGRDHYLLPFPEDVKMPPTPARRATSSSSTVPLLVLTPGNSRVQSRNISPMQGRLGSAAHQRQQTATDQRGSTIFNANFAERTGTASSLAYPETAHRGPRRQYGTLGHVMHSTYTAAQRAYRGRHRLNFWSAWMAPWLKNEPRLAIIDEESVGTSRLSRIKQRKTGNDSGSSSVSSIFGPSVARNGVIPKDMAGSVGTFQTGTTTTSGYSIRGTPPAFEKVDAGAEYNPSMARSLTRRLLKVGFEAKDGIATTTLTSAGFPVGTEAARQSSGAWKGRTALKKRALERQKSEKTGSGRLFSLNFQRKKVMQDGGEDEDAEDYDGEDYEDEEEEEADGDDEASVDGLAKTSIRDFAHAFNQDIFGIKGEENISTTGTIRIHSLVDDDDYDEEDQNRSSTPAETDYSPLIAATTNLESNSVIDENIPTVSTTPSTTRTKVSTPMGTMRGRKTFRDLADTPNSQKKRMERNTPKNTTSRVALDADEEGVKNDFEDITKGTLETS